MLKRLLIFSGVGLLFLTIIYAVGYHFAGTLKPRAEMTLSKVLQMEAKINNMGFSFCPVCFTANGVEIRNSGIHVASIDRIKLHVKVVSLLKKEFRLVSLELVKPNIYITRLKSGKLNIEPARKKGTGGDEFHVEQLIIKNGEITYPRAGIDIKGINASLNGFRKINSTKLARSFEFKGQVKSKSIRKGPVILSGISANVEAKGGKFVVSPVTFNAMQGKGKAYMKADLSGIMPVMELSMNLFKLSVDKCLGFFSDKDMLHGDLDIFARLKLRGRLDYLRKNINGRISMRGTGLSFHLVNLDKFISRFNKTQKFNALDLGAFLILGPVGPAVTRGVEFSNLMKKAPAGKTEVKALVSDWEIRSGMAEAKDVAIATDRNRIALKGSIDLDRERFNDVKVAVVDEKGRAVVSRSLDGPFNNPAIKGKTKFLDALMGPAVKLLRGTAEFLFGSKRNPFYSGSVAAPN